MLETTVEKAIYPSATAMVEEGGLGSVVVDQKDLGVATGKMTAKILKGAKPADSAVEIFATGKSVVNKKPQYKKDCHHIPKIIILNKKTCSLLYSFVNSFYSKLLFWVYDGNLSCIVVFCSNFMGL